MPQYTLLLYTPAHDRPPADDPGMDVSRWAAYTKGLQDAGLLVATGRLRETESATTVRVRDGETLITDGPFAETNEYLGGYFVLDCPNLDVALEQAARVPHIHYGSVEVRPVNEAPLDASAADNTSAQASAEV
jgi:hypothetical protein